MTSSSINSSSSAMQSRTRGCSYDVFLSFCGDTLNNFTDHLYAALQRNDISAFMDDIYLNKGESPGPGLFRAIEDSQIFIVVLSKTYASSVGCLRELEHILLHGQQSKKPVCPVFYDVEPSEVRKQSGIYGEAFIQHEQRFQQDSQMVLRWRKALNQVANISGWFVHNSPQSSMIEKIVETIKKMLGRKLSSLPKDLVWMDSPIEQLEKLLLLDSVDDVRVVGICGMGGSGKTTLATVLYDRISHQFDVCCFVDGASKLYIRDDPIKTAKHSLHHLRALIIVDNIDQCQKLKSLVVFPEWLTVGSRIVVISGDAQTLKQYKVDVIYEVPVLNQTNSLQLFSQKPLKRDQIISSHEELVYDVLNYVNGLPLAIKALSLFLSCVDIFKWRSALARLRESPNKDIMDVLRLSFDSLDENEKEIFLDIACLFNGREEDYVKNVLNSCGFHADIILTVLFDKSLIRISDESKIEMHPLLEELGRKIVHEDSDEKSRKCSRLWLHKQLYNVVVENMENNIEAVVLYKSEREEAKLMAETLSNMNHLRLLILKGVKCLGSLDNLSNELRYVEWDEYPFMYLPSNFQPDQLVELILVDSNIKQLWEGKKDLPNLRTLDLSYSENLTKMPYFDEFPNLKQLNLEGCVKLVQIDSSFGLLRKLVFLNLKNCESLKCIPKEISDLTTLEYLNLCGCSKAPVDFASCVLPSSPSFSLLSELDISFCSLSQIPDTLGFLHLLESLNLKGNNFVTLPSLRELSKLKYLNLEHCKQLKSLTELPSLAAIKLGKYKRAGLFIFNCPELGEREQCRNMTLSWMMHFIQANQYSSVSFHQFDIVIPGSEIPQWFNNRRMGRSISIDPSPVVYDSNITGIACCVVFSVEPFDPTTTRYDLGPVIRLGFKSSNAANYNYVVIPVTLYRYLITVKSDHMWLIYFDRELFFSFLRSIDNTLWELDHIMMEASVLNGQGLHLEIKNCGFCWVFKQDQQPFDSPNNDVLWKERPATLLAIEDEAQNRKHKYNKSSD